MLERRAVHRRRVCLEGALTCGPAGPISAVRVRNLSDYGAEIVVPEVRPDASDVELSVARTDVLRQARVVWRRMDRLGLEFRPSLSVGSSEAVGTSRLLTEFLRAKRAHRRAR